jgi:GNAT superfamily N-acetyltransferase
MNIRKADMGDLNTLVELRLDCLRAMDGLSEEEEAVVRPKLKPYFTEHLDRDLIVAVAETSDGTIVSTAFIVTLERPPKPSFITGRVGTLLNVYTRTEYRGKGVATGVVSYILEEARKINVSMVDLTATPDGKPIYVKLGFKKPHYEEMELQLI